MGKSVLVVRCGALGDLVYATSIIDALKHEYGDDTSIDFVTTPGISKLFDKDNRVQNIFTLKHKKVPLLLSSDKQKIIKHAKKKPYDLLVNLESAKYFKQLCDKIDAEKKVGFEYSDIVVPQNVTHMVEIMKYVFKDAVSETNFNNAYPKLVGTPKNEVKTKFGLKEKYLIISPSNSHQKKNRLNYRAWENESWIELIKLLSGKIQVVIIGNKGEEIFFEKLRPFPHGVVDLVGKTSLPDLIGIIEGASGLVATDTGTAHISSAVNTEVFALIGPTPADQTGPYKTPHNKVHIISANLECSPCYKTEVMKNCKDNLCMKRITAQMVFDSIDSAKLL